MPLHASDDVLDGNDYDIGKYPHRRRGYDLFSPPHAHAWYLKRVSRHIFHWSLALL